MQTTKPILTITGSDPTGGSGIQADIKTVASLGGHAVTAITSVTVQTTLGIEQFYDLPPAVVAGQIDAVMSDAEPLTVKVGMIRSREVLDAVVGALLRYRPRHIIYMPVAHSSQGDALMPPDVVSDVKQRLLPLCTVVVCRRHEAEALGLPAGTYQLDDATTHGLANAFASAVACFLNRGEACDEALRQAKTYLNTLAVAEAGLSGRSNELFREFAQAVEENFRHNSDVRFYAEALRVSSNYLAQVTKRISGKAPKAIIDERLTAEARQQLLLTNRNVQEIAYDLGFSNQAHFAKFFKKQTGQSPSIFRKHNLTKTTK